MGPGCSCRWSHPGNTLHLGGIRWKVHAGCCPAAPAAAAAAHAAQPSHPLPWLFSQVRMQREALDAKKKARVGLAKDDEWSGDGFVAEAASMVSNE